jgi:NADH-quinone oxidoreductase subunit E
VATFYTMFNLDPVGRYFIQFCGTTPCVLRGAGEIKKVLQRRVGEERHISDNGLFSWLEVECLGACCNAPMVQINDDYYEDLTPENFEKLLDDLASGRPVKPGSQIGRRSSEPEGAVHTLQDPALFDGSVVGAWRNRFEEEALKVVADEAAAAAASLPKDSKVAKPPAGRATESDAADTPAKRIKEGETPVAPAEQKRASSRSRATASKKRPIGEAVPSPQSGKSYEPTPSDPAEGRVVPASPTTPVAGTPPSEGGKRDGSASKPDVPVDKNKTP